MAEFSSIKLVSKRFLFENFNLEPSTLYYCFFISVEGKTKLSVVSFSL
jgi:hypothetical protein